VTTIKRRKLFGKPINWSTDTPDVMQRIYAARGVVSPEGLSQRLVDLISPSRLGGIDTAVEILINAILKNKRIMVAGDYDCDGATGTAVAIKGLRILGATCTEFIIPNRFLHGYGLSVPLVDAMSEFKPDVIVTVDSGVASVEGVIHAKSKGIVVVITDHHLPPEGPLPPADAIVNPNLKGDQFPSKMLAGVGVMFYVLMAIRTKLRLIGHWKDKKEPSLMELTDLVAFGTIADLVPLDQNNRILVETGLRRIRSGNCSPGILALAQIAKKDYSKIISKDISFSLAPRINAAGRMQDMRVGVLTLLETDPAKALELAKCLDEINQDRREKQTDMIEQAEKHVLNIKETGEVGIVVYDKSWHHGIVGLVAARLKENLHRPVIAFAPDESPEVILRGSCRSIAGFHMRDALVLVDTRNPGLIQKFGGHAMAAGLSIKEADLERFRIAFDNVAKELLNDDLLSAVIYSDGELSSDLINIDFADHLAACGPWGQAFPEPVFDNVFYCEDYVVLGGKHLKMKLIDPKSNSSYEAIYFNGLKGPEPHGLIRVAYELNVNSWKDRRSLQLMVRYLEKAEVVL
jgi:single-stranded-DNA-specific exonuclease